MTSGMLLETARQHKGISREKLVRTLEMDFGYDISVARFMGLSH